MAVRLSLEWVAATVRRLPDGESRVRVDGLVEGLDFNFIAKTEERFDKADFIYIARDDENQCPAVQRVIYRFSRQEHSLQLSHYFRRTSRWTHEAVVEAV